MGNNQAFTIMEATVIGAYDLGVLDQKLLKVLVAPYRGSDIDSGGKVGLTTKVGKMEIEEVVVLTMGGKMPVKPAKKEPKKWVTDDPTCAAWDDYYEAVYKAFHAITYKQFGWR